VCDLTHSCVWHDSFICVTRLIHMCDMIHWCVWHVSFISVTWLIHVCDMTDSYVWHDWFMCVTWFIHMCDVTHSYVWHDSFMCVTWLIHIHAVACLWHVEHYQCMLSYIFICTHRYVCTLTEDFRLQCAPRYFILLHITHDYPMPQPLHPPNSRRISDFISLHFHMNQFFWYIFWGTGLRFLVWNPIWYFGDSRENLLDILAVVVIWSCNDLIWTCNDVKADLLRPCTSQSWPLIHVDSILLDITWHYLTLLDITWHYLKLLNITWHY
jgi:hypothetical protein